MRKKIKTLYKGEMRTLKEIAEIEQLNANLVKNRYYRGVRGSKLGEKKSKGGENAKQFVSINGNKMRLSEVAKTYNIPEQTIRERYRNGIRGNKILKAPTKNDIQDKKSITLTFEGEKTTITKLARTYNLPNYIVYDRYKKGWKDQDIVKPVDTRESEVIEYQGKKICVGDLIEQTKTNFSAYDILKRYENGLRDEDLIRLRPIQKVNFKGEWKTFSELSKEYGIYESTIRARYLRGLTNDELVDPPEHYGKSENFSKYMILYGKEMTAMEISQKYNINISTIKSRWYKGLRDDELVKPPIKRKWKNIKDKHLY